MILNGISKMQVSSKLLMYTCLFCGVPKSNDYQFFVFFFQFASHLEWLNCRINCPLYGSYSCLLRFSFLLLIPYQVFIQFFLKSNFLIIMLVIKSLYQIIGPVKSIKKVKRIPFSTLILAMDSLQMKVLNLAISTHLTYSLYIVTAVLLSRK